MAATAVQSQQTSSATTQAIRHNNNTVEMTRTSDSTLTSAYRYMIAWILIFVVLVLLNKTKLGHTVIYYTLVLAIVLLLITQSAAIASILKPLQPKGAASGGGGSAGGF